MICGLNLPSRPPARIRYAADLVFKILVTAWILGAAITAMIVLPPAGSNTATLLYSMVLKFGAMFLGWFLLLLFGQPSDLTTYGISTFGSVVWQVVYLVLSIPVAYSQFAGIRVVR